MSKNNNGYDPLFPWEGVVANCISDCSNSSLSDSQRFTSVWIAFNAWMKGQFGTKCTDRQLIERTKTYQPLITLYKYLKRGDVDFAEALGSFSECEIINSKNSEAIRYDGTFESLIETMYALRGNTVHGTDLSGKNSTEHQLGAEILYTLLMKISFQSMG